MTDEDNGNDGIVEDTAPDAGLALPDDPENQAEAPDEPAPPAEPAAPALGDDRIASLDVVRGFALLGILLVNAWAYGLPFPAAMNPAMVGLDSLTDRIVYVFVHMFAYSKTMPIFSMLFGAGIVLFATRAEAKGNKPAGYFAGRQLWLLVFGLLHAYLLWNGDILVPYAVVGLIVYLFRKKRPRTLIILAVLSLLVIRGVETGFGFFLEFVEGQAHEAELALAADEPLTEWQERSQEIWEGTGPTWNPSAEDIEELATVKRGDYAGIISHMAPETVMMHLFMYPLTASWAIAGFMLLGMALFKTGAFSGERSTGFYRKLAGAGYGLGFPLALVGMWLHFTRFENMGWMLTHSSPFVEVGGMLVALGHIAVLVLVVKSGAMGAVCRRLAAVGRMAFTNYIAHTLICTTVFYGYGFGRFAAWDRLALLGLTVAIWVLQLWWSTWWLARFRFGPLEWVWRTLTYRKRQPLRREPVVLES
ncbi:MAG: DUF418 domain-containing protein [bacterium]|nr:DUF418 domain-containing protein [bacterium]